MGLSIGPDGLIPKRDVKAMLDQKHQLDRDFKNNLIINSKVIASEVRNKDSKYAARYGIDGKTQTFWATSDGVKKASLTIIFGKETTFNRLLLQEHIALGQRIHAFQLEVKTGETWTPITSETTVGYKRILRFTSVTGSQARITFETDAPCLTLSNLGIYNAPPIMADPIITRGKNGIISLKGQPGVTLYYAVGNSDAQPYTAPFPLPMGGAVKAYAVLDDHKSGITEIRFGISKKNWKILDVDSENTEREDSRAIFAIDDNPNTIWHSQWVTGKPNHPHHISIDLGEKMTLAGFTYLPRTNSVGGVIFGYAFYVSQDGKNWGKPVAEGEFDNIANNPIEQEVRFKKTQKARYIKLVSKSAIQNQPFASAAEIGVISK